ncbi:MAG: hypothetical protein R2867_43675 [Caldilineaceae bacterium]
MNALNPVRTVGSQIAELIARHTMQTSSSLLPQGRTLMLPTAGTSEGSGHDRSANGMRSMNPARTVGSQIPRNHSGAHGP